MSKDHVPSDFARKSGYKSDLEVAETGPMVKSVNTSFGSKNHNAYIHRSDGTHEHFFYSPKDAKSGWHGHNWETHNNHPQKQVKANTKVSPEGGKTMDRNSFVESIKVDKATIDRCNEVSRNAAKNANIQVGRKNGADDGGRERGDTGPASLGRESGNKSGPSNAHTSTGESQGHSGQASSGHGESGHGSAGGQCSGGGHGTGGQGSGGHGSGGQGGH